MKLTSMILMIVITAAPAFAMQAITGQIVRNESVGFYLENTDELMNEYNTNIENVPGFVKKVLGSERINLEITMIDDTMREFGVVTEKGKVLSVDNTSLDDPTVIVSVKEETIKRIIESSDQVSELQKAIDDKEISIEAVGFGMKFKMFFAKMFLKIGSWFS